MSTEEPRLVVGDLIDDRGRTTNGAIVLTGDVITWVGPREQVPEQWRDAPPPQGWPQAGRHLLTPGLVDLHCHGAGGAEFGSPLGEVGPEDDPVRARVEAGRTAARLHRAHGTTTLVASMVSNTPDNLLTGARALGSLVAQGELAGIHVEGPFLSEERRGAQNPAVLTDGVPALVTRLGEAVAEAGAVSSIVQMTVAPERDVADGVLQTLIEIGAVPAVGHTSADAERTADWLGLARERCADAGVRDHRPLVTHVFNGMPPMHHRSPGPVGVALGSAARGDAVLEVIADGRHLAPHTVRMAFDLAGPGNVVLITDAMSACLMPEGLYTLGGQEVRVADGEARLVAHDSLAGSVATMADCLAFAVQQAGIDLVDAVRAATLTPARILDGPDTLRGRLVPGAPADLVAWDADLRPRAVLARGDLVTDSVADGGDARS